MAYAAVTSLQYTIDRFSISGHIKIVRNSSPEMIKLLEEEGRSLQNVLVGLDNNSRRFSSKRLHALDAQITDVVFKLEDVLESHLLHQFVSQSQHVHQHPLRFFIDIEELKQDIDSLIEKVNRLKAEYINELSNNILPVKEEEEEEESEDDVIVKKESRMFGSSNQLFMEIKDVLFRNSANFYPFGLWGMAGIGKTALARKLFQDPQILSHYESHVFVTLGPEYQLEDVYLDILEQLDPDIVEDQEIIMLLQGEGDSQEKLGVLERRLNECLEGRKYLIVLDDVWDYKMLQFFYRVEYDRSPEGSRILLTTRLRSLATNAMHNWEIPFLDKKGSWDLLCAKVFGDQDLCTPQLERAGKKIAENCEGLPLTLVTVANILSKQEMSAEHWNDVAANKQHAVYAEAYDKMHKVLLPSYYCLPQYLRMSFLYMGVFPQNYKIPCTKLYDLWKAEGFVHLEKYSVYKDHFTKLLYNNVLLVHNRGSISQFKIVGLHSSFWYLCKKEAHKSKFFHSFSTLDDCFTQDMETQRRLCIYNPVLFAIKDAFDKMASVSTARSLLCTGLYHQYPVPICFGLRLLRVLKALPIHFYEFPTEVLKLIHLTYFALTCDGDLPASVSKLWNLKYLIVDRRLSIKSSTGAPSYLPGEIWDMKTLKHLQVIGSDLPETREGFLRNLFKLLDVSLHSCTKRILERVPNLRKLGIRIELYPDVDVHQPLACSDYICNMPYLSAFKCVVVNPRIMFEVAAPPPIALPIFPEDLVKLTLSGLGYPWEEMSKISSLPNLQVLKLLGYAFQGPKWDVQDEEFPSLEVLVIEETDLVHWTINDNYHIEYLRLLSIKHCYNLEEMPMEFTEILRTIEVVDCNPMVVSSANKVKEDWDGKYYKSLHRGLELNVHSSWD